MGAFQRFLNPFLLHLQRFCLELKCPLCLNLLNRPTLLPCNHIFCNFCIPRGGQFKSECPTCQHRFVDREARSAPYMENMINIYRSLDATFNATLFPPAPLDTGRMPEQCPVSAKTNANDKLRKEHVETPEERNPDNRQSILSLTANKRAYASLGGKSPMLNSVQEGNEKHIELVITTSQMEQLSPGCPPSFGDTNRTDGYGGLGSSNNSVEKSKTKRLLDNDLDRGGGGMNKGGTSGANHARDVKRQKNLNNGFFEIDAKSNGPTQQKNLCAENITSRCEPEGKFGEPLSCEQSTMILDLPDVNRSACAFCFSSNYSEGTGPMLHYANGKEVVGDMSSFSNVIHVHQKCIFWLPQVHNMGEEIKNLESELASAAELKCSTCGKKGAALGCFVKSCRRSYHLPCALNLDCRWDSDDFLMLCPIHKSIKFPKEKKSQSRKHASGEKQPVPTQMTSKKPNFEATSPSVPKEWVLCGDALSAEEEHCMFEFASSCGATVSRCWAPNVTHVIAATDGNGACTRTLTFLMAILKGKWILTMDWIKASTVAKQPVEEYRYEVKLDNHGSRDGPMTGRVFACHNHKLGKLFRRIKFYFDGSFLPAYKNELVNLITTGGGTVIKRRGTLTFVDDLDEEIPRGRTLIIYNDDPKQQCDFNEQEYVVLEKLRKAEKLAEFFDTWVIKPTWILDSIAAFKLQPVFDCF